jgi:RNA polymerase sigma factor (sigma-70 family)
VRPNAEFAEAAERHLDDVLAFLVYLTGDRNVAEDLTAETFARALERWRRYDPRRGSARTWLCQLARSTALDHFRSEERRRRREGRYSLEVRDSAEAAFGEGLSPELEAALARLSAAERGCCAARRARAGRQRRPRPGNQRDRVLDTLSALQKLEKEVSAGVAA